jgi:hypothetical protein
MEDEKRFDIMETGDVMVSCKHRKVMNFTGDCDRPHSNFEGDFLE